jgi:hypothetical protein
MLYKYLFHPDVDMDDVESALVLAAWGVESLHGETQARLAAGHAIDRTHKTCVIDTETNAGNDLNTLFYGYVRREIGDTAFVVERVRSERKERTP